MPRLERNLLAERKIHKKEMFKAEAIVKMNDGTATDDEFKFYNNMKWAMVQKNSLSKQEAKNAEADFVVNNAKQLSVKIACNSVGGNTPIPCLIEGLVVYRAIEELFCGESIIDESEGNNEVCVGPKNVKVWSDKGWTKIKYVMRHPAPKIMHRVLTHIGCVDVTRDHSLLTPEGIEVKSTEVKKGEP
jgi:hypothetical protein